EDKQHEEISEHLYRVKASMPIEEFNELIGGKFSSDEVDTIGGLIFSLFGELPKVKSTLIYNNLHFTVDKIVGNRIESIIVKKL
ncbi:MAG: magnesium/cobalt efflux protein, partial [Candidatus Marinimicrobia bacterium]|nr:magnesium/cobalt efflux protein [Candidatus Neomarinimicrobiota bacterium]